MVARTGQPSVRGRLTLFVGGNRVAESIVFIKRD
jgi:hypothetical protein